MDANHLAVADAPGGSVYRRDVEARLDLRLAVMFVTRIAGVEEVERALAGDKREREAGGELGVARRALGGRLEGGGRGRSICLKYNG